MTDEVLNLDIETALKASGRHIQFRYRVLGRDYSEQGTTDLVQQGGSINYDYLSEVKRVASFVIHVDAGINYNNQMLQPIMLMFMPDGSTVEWSLGVFVLEATKERYDKGFTTRSVNGYDLAIILKRSTPAERYAIQEGENVTEHIQFILESHSLHFNIEHSDKELPAPLEWEPGTNYLEIVNDLLKSIGYQSLFFDSSGTAIVQVYQNPGSASPSVYYRTDEFSVVAEQTTRELDIFNVPNRWVMTVSVSDRDELFAAVVNNDPDSETSVSQRGFVVTRFERADSEVVDQDTLNEEVMRMAVEDTAIFEWVDFHTAIMPDHGEREIVQLDHDAASIHGQFAEITWGFTLAPGSLMSHRVRRALPVEFTVEATFVFDSSGSWTAPEDVHRVRVECWGAGGGRNTTGTAPMSGGAGGAYAMSEIDVVGGQTYSFVVAPNSQADGERGPATNFNGGQVVAESALGPAFNDGVSCGNGRASQSTGDVVLSGGCRGQRSGLSSTADAPGGGGGAAASLGDGRDGGNAIDRIPGHGGGSGPGFPPGGTGGGGSTTEGGAGDGLAPGGGGGGMNHGGTVIGAHGRIRITVIG